MVDIWQTNQTRNQKLSICNLILSLPDLVSSLIQSVCSQGSKSFLSVLNGLNLLLRILLFHEDTQLLLLNIPNPIPTSLCHVITVYGLIQLSAGRNRVKETQ